MSRIELTGVVARLRGMALIESMQSSTRFAGWRTRFGGYDIPRETPRLLTTCFDDTLRVYNQLPQPPWVDDVDWGPQEVAGHATTLEGETGVCW